MTANDIRRRFRQLMDGVVSENMRLCGTTYHINWGISLTHLQSLASEYEQDMHVALELWKDHVRESRIMALMLMPPEEFTPDIAKLWSETLQTQEIAEMAAMLLYQHVAYAPAFAYSLLSGGDALQSILGFNIISRLVGQGHLPDARGLDELIDNIRLSLSEGDTGVRRAAYNCLVKLDSSDRLSASPYWHTLCQGLL